MATTTRVYKSGNSQSLRIPKDLAYERTDIEYIIERVGDEIRARPAPRRLTGLADKFHGFSPDFMERREEEEDQERDAL